MFRKQSNSELFNDVFLLILSYMVDEMELISILSFRLGYFRGCGIILNHQAQLWIPVSQQAPIVDIGRTYYAHIVIGYHDFRVDVNNLSYRTNFSWWILLHLSESVLPTKFN